MNEVAARSVGAVSSDPVLLAELGLVLGVPGHVPLHLVLAVRELAELAVEAGALLLEVPADLGLEPWVGAAVAGVEEVLAPALQLGGPAPGVLLGRRGKG